MTDTEWARQVARDLHYAEHIDALNAECDRIGADMEDFADDRDVTRLWRDMRDRGLFCAGYMGGRILVHADDLYGRTGGRAIGDAIDGRASVFDGVAYAVSKTPSLSRRAALYATPYWDSLDGDGVGALLDLERDCADALSECRGRIRGADDCGHRAETLRDIAGVLEHLTETDDDGLSAVAHTVPQVRINTAGLCRACAEEVGREVDRVLDEAESKATHDEVDAETLEGLEDLRDAADEARRAAEEAGATREAADERRRAEEERRERDEADRLEAERRRRDDEARRRDEEARAEEERRQAEEERRRREEEHEALHAEQEARHAAEAAEERAERQMAEAGAAGAAVETAHSVRRAARGMDALRSVADNLLREYGAGHDDGTEAGADKADPEKEA